MQNVYFVPSQDENEKEKMSVNNICSLEKPAVWKENPFEIIWHVKWTARGLLPVKPCIHVRGKVTIPAGRALVTKKS